MRLCALSTTIDWNLSFLRRFLPRHPSPSSPSPLPSRGEGGRLVRQSSQSDGGRPGEGCFGCGFAALCSFSAIQLVIGGTFEFSSGRVRSGMSSCLLRPFRCLAVNLGKDEAYWDRKSDWTSRAEKLRRGALQGLLIALGNRTQNHSHATIRDVSGLDLTVWLSWIHRLDRLERLGPTSSSCRDDPGGQCRHVPN